MTYFCEARPMVSELCPLFEHVVYMYLHIGNVCVSKSFHRFHFI